MFRSIGVRKTALKKLFVKFSKYCCDYMSILKVYKPTVPQLRVQVFYTFLDALQENVK